MRKSFSEINKVLGDSVSRLFILTLFWLSGTCLMSQNQVVSGVVAETSGLPIVGANISEKGTTHGTISDVNGRFTIQVSPNATLDIRFIGFLSQEIPVDGRSTINVVMKDDTYQLESVVVVGFGQQKKESVVGAISSLNTKDLLQSSSSNITQAIAGRIPGLITTQSSGAPGADNAALYIRGRASFAGDNQPLIMVDGVQREFSQIAPDDIESISVLKDASATAVYGVRGANGVILVTTKRGKEQKPTISFTADYRVQTPTRKDTYLNSYQSVTLLEEALKNDGLASQFSASDIEKYKQSSEGRLSAYEQQLYPNVNWYNEILKKSAPASRYNVNIQGGTKRMRYFTSLEYFNQGGLYRDNNNYDYGQSANVNYRRYSFRANLDFLLTKDFTASINFGTRFEERKGPNVTENSTYNEVFYELNHSPGWLYPVQYENGFYGGNSQNQNNIAAKLANGGFYETTRTVNETNFILKHDLNFVTQGLSAKGMLSFDYDSEYDRRFRAGFATYELINRSNPELESSYTRYGEDTELAYAGNTQWVSMKTYLEFALNYARTFGVHEVTGLLLYNQNDFRYQAELAKRYQGLVGRATYNYDRRYFAELNCGYNGSENFAKGNRFGFFPSFSAGWMLTNEKFMRNTSSWLDMLKVRASYGEVGNDVFQRNGVDVRFLYMASWTQLSNAYLFGQTNYQMGIFEGTYPNLAVTWERARKYNAGLESSFFQGLINLNVDVFKENRDNILTDYLTVPGWVAVEMAPGNLGKTTNSGYELELRHRHHIGKVNYNVSATFSHARNKIKAMDEPLGKPGYRKREGHPINQYFGLVADGFITQADIDGGTLAQSSFGDVQAGDLKYRDLNQDGFIDQRDETFIGFSDIPENTYSFTLGVNYKGWAMNAMFQGVSNVSRYYDAEAMYAFVNGGKVKEHHLQRWNPAVSEAQNLANAKYPLLHYDQNGNHNQQLNSFFLKNGNFLRLKNVELSYTLPSLLTQRWLMNEVRIYANGSNLFTWDKLDKLTDPESNGSNLYPIMKTVSFGVSVKF